MVGCDRKSIEIPLPLLNIGLLIFDIMPLLKADLITGFIVCAPPQLLLKLAEYFLLPCAQRVDNVSTRVLAR